MRIFQLTSVFLLAFLLCFKFNLFAQEWQWAISGQGNNFDYPLAVVIDNQDNLYVTGYFQSSTLRFGNINLINSGGEDIFLVKFSPSGDVIWAKSFGGSGAERGTCLARDSSGFLYLGGYFESNNIQFGTSTFNPIGGWDIFLMKFDPSGNVLWVKTFGSANYEEASSIACSKNAIAMTGEFSGKSITFGNFTLLNQGEEGLSDIFTIKLSLDGNVIWAKAIGGRSFERPHSISFDHNENIYIACSFNSLKMPIGTDTLNGKGYSDVIIVKYSNEGEILWYKYGGGRDKDYLTSMAIDNQNNVIIAGYTMSNDFEFMKKFIINAGSYDFFIIKFSSDGTIYWFRVFGDSADEYATGITVDNDGYIYLAGSFASDSVYFSSYVLLRNSSNNNTTDIYLAKLRPDGTPIWAISGRGNNEDRSNAIAIDNSKNIYTTGYFESKDLYLGTNDLYNMGYSNVFVAKVSKTMATNNDENHTPFQVINFSNQIIIEFNEEFENHTISLIDILGRILLRENTNLRSINIPMANLSPGTYFLQVGNTIIKVFLAK